MPMMFKGFFRSCTIDRTKRPMMASRSVWITSRTYCRLNSRNRLLISRNKPKARAGERSTKTKIAGRGMKYTVVSVLAVAHAERGF